MPVAEIGRDLIPPAIITKKCSSRAVRTARAPLNLSALRLRLSSQHTYDNAMTTTDTEKNKIYVGISNNILYTVRKMVSSYTFKNWAKFMFLFRYSAGICYM